jgi:hypothetical protein
MMESSLFFPDTMFVGSLFDEQSQVLPVLSPTTPTIAWSSLSSGSGCSSGSDSPTTSFSPQHHLISPSTVNPLQGMKVSKPLPTPPTSTRRTVNHRSAERRRRQSIKEGMKRLGEVLSYAAARCDSLQATHLRAFAGGKRPSKVQLLDAGIEHILVLQQAVVQLARENEALRGSGGKCL